MLKRYFFEIATISLNKGIKLSSVSAPSIVEFLFCLSTQATVQIAPKHTKLYTTG
jgi:hypothetical protein